jgi:voltage-gated sodium channel
MGQTCRKIADNENFQTFILFLILVVSATMGLETIPELAAGYESMFLAIHFFVQAVFVFEIAVRWLAHAPQYKIFFCYRWNIFDFVIVVLSFLPTLGAFALIARLLRVFRVFSVSDHLRGFIERLRCTLDEIIYLFLMIMVLSYIFIVSGLYLFAEIDPKHWATLGTATLSVFHMFFLQDLTTYTQPILAESSAYLIYFIVFYFTFIFLFFSALVAAIAQEIKGERKTL